MQSFLLIIVSFDLLSYSITLSLFLSQVSLHDILRRLKLCGWYWGELSSDQADDILQPAADGSFILRDSTDACHLFTLSLKAHNMVISVRVQFSRGLFKLDSSAHDCPSFSSVVDLVDYYLSDCHRFFYVEVPGFGEVLVTLRHPILKETLSLQHLCCIAIVRHCRTPEEIYQLPLPSHLKRNLLEFCPETPFHD